MNHIDDEVLMKIALQLLEEGEEVALHEHLSACDDCKARLARIRRDMELIGSLEPRIDRPFIPLTGARGLRIPAWLKVAAVLLVGFVIGYSVSQLYDGQVIYIVPHHVHLSPPMHTYPGFTYCESVDLAADSYPKVRIDSVSR